MTATRILLFFWLLLSLAAEALPPALEQALGQPAPVEILSLDPAPPALRPGPTSGGFSILGRARLDQREGSHLCAAVLRGLQDGDREGGALPSCFEPRHALRFGDLDLVICYSCHRWQAFQQGLDIGGGLISQQGSQECERAVIGHGLDWQGWAELDNRFFHASGFSIALPPFLKAGRRSRDEVLQPEVSRGTVVFHSIGKADRWFTNLDPISLESPLPLAELQKSLRQQIPGVVAELDPAANQMDVYALEENLGSAVFVLLSPDDPENVAFYPSRDAKAARDYLREARAALESNGQLKESSPGQWTVVSPGHYRALVLLQRGGSYLVCQAKFRCDEAAGRQRLDELLSSVHFKDPTAHP